MARELTPAHRDGGSADGKRTFFVNAKDTSGGETFFEPLTGAQLTAISTARYDTVDAITIQTTAGQATFVAPHDGFIAIELRRPDQDQVNLGFRNDIRHSRLSLALSVQVGHDVLYHDAHPITGETVSIDPTREFTNLVVTDDARINQISPTWYTEDWTTIDLGPTSVVIRADARRSLGAVLETPDSIGVITYGSSTFDSRILFLAEPISPVPAQVIR